jgi:hypothetical protein
MANELAKPQSVLTDEDKRNLNLAVLSETTSVMNPVEYAQIKKVARDFWESNALSKSFANETQIVMAMLVGHEMGMSFNQSVSDLYFVGGKLNVYGKGTPGALRRNGWRISYVDETPESCTARIENPKTGEVIEDTFTYAEAVASGFTGNNKPGWLPGANRRRKLRYGVLSLIIHTYVPEVLGAATGIGEYSEDYLDSERMVVENKTDVTKARIAAAEAKFKENSASEHTAKAVKPQSVTDTPETSPTDEPTVAVEA